MWKYKLRNRFLSAQIRWTEKAAIFVAHLLPREVAYWVFIRVVTEECDEYPGDQIVSDVQKRWIRNTQL